MNYTTINIALALGISRHTVDDYLKQVYCRYRVQSRVEAVLAALHYRHLEVEEVLGGSGDALTDLQCDYLWGLGLGTRLSSLEPFVWIKTLIGL